MKIVVMGAGKVGQTICSDLSEESYDITLIEKKDNILQEVIIKNDVNGVLGNGASYDIQKEAGVDKTDVFIAVTENDELNMIACVLAKNIGAEYTIARVRSHEYSELSSLMKKSLGIDYLINPELQAAETISRLIEFPQAYSYESFAYKKAPIVEMKVSKNSNLVLSNLYEFRKRYNNIIICCANEFGEVFIPKGNYKIKEGSNIFVTGPIKEINKLFRENRQENTKIKSAFIIGGGLITIYLLRILRNFKTKVKVIELDVEKARKLSSQFPDIKVINDDGTSLDCLKEQRAQNYDSLISLTGIDEENIIISMVANNLGIKKILTKVNRTELLGVVDTVGLQSVITPKRIVADGIVQIVRSLDNALGSNIETLHTIAEGKVEALQFIVSNNSRLTGIKIKDLNIIDDILLAYIYRDGEVIFPKGDDILKNKDRVLVISKVGKLKDLNEILR